MAVAMSLWNFQLYPDDENISLFLGGGEDEEKTFSDEELNEDPPNPFDVELVDNPFDVDIDDNPFGEDISDY